MKTLLLVLWLAFLGVGCKVYKPIEKAGYVTDQNLSHFENIQRQLMQLETGQKLQVFLKNEKQVVVTFQKTDPKTLFANYNLPKNHMPVEIPIQEIESVKVSKFSLPLTGALVAVGGIVAVLIWDNSSSNWFEGFTIPLP
ncbi:hypothetical protein J0A67_00915 [Algoriphagus aestuariicola]|uniref:Lipoprotein n=1 Tax=Algoriphagus aestuariicola TaxID=1852016 RepID=A0ABS3BJD1_9BACT|nr:hypothetical protein [Algoriphagus aestuariicola]MBN7799397.1 hypothetical protein [Algoriphagus aestuariicola]